MSDKPSLVDCAVVAARNSEFVANWARLRGIALPKTPMDLMIDNATGRSGEIGAQFIADVKELVYDRL